MKKFITLIFLFSAFSSFSKDDKDDGSTEFYLKTGFTGITEVGALFARGGGAFSFNEVLGGRKNQHFYGGMGFGLDINRSVLIAPVTIDLRAYFLTKRITPFLDLAPGYGFVYALHTTSGSNTAHTFIGNVGVGVEYKIKKNIGVLLNAGYRITVLPVLHATTGIGHSGFIRFGIEY